MTTGITVPVSACVWALNALQNSMMLMPCWPRAGPTGGAGDALPPAAWGLIVVRTFFAMALPDGTRCGEWGGWRDPRQIFLTWSKPTSTGVSRPKIETRTLSFEA